MATPTVLFAQEFGRYAGHVTSLATIARALSPGRCVFAVPQPEVAHAIIEPILGPGIEVVDLHFPVRSDAVAPRVPDRTLADTFYKLGYAEPDRLHAAAGRWRDLIDRVRPDLVVSDYAPSLRLACWNAVPVVVVGSGFSTPPSNRRLPPVGMAGGADATSLWREDRLVDAARSVRAALGGPPLGFFGDLFNGERLFVTTTPGCDPYRAWRTAPIFHPLTQVRVPAGPPVSQRTGPDVFCFLWSDHPAVDTLLTVLNGLPRRSEVHIRGADVPNLIRQCAPQVGVHVQSADFAALLPQTRLFLHYGAAGAAYAGLLAGTPQLICPASLEHETNGLGMVRTGVAHLVGVARPAEAPVLRGKIEAMLGDKTLHRQARKAATSTREGRKREPVPAIVAACRDLLGVASA